MSLQDKLDAKRKEVESGAPPEAVKIMHRATDDLLQSGIMERVLTVGDTAPEFSLPDQHGNIINSADLLAKGPLVISFYRGAWWPYCNIELEALQKKVAGIEALGASFVLISPQVEKHSAEMVQKHNLTMPVLRDPGNKIASRFGLVFRLPDDLRTVYKSFGIDLEKYNGDDSWSLPMPGRFILDQEGVILSREVHPDYTVRPDPEEIIDLLKNM